MRKNACRKHERGMALILVLLALLLVSAVGLGMIYMSTTETSINTNYKDTQLAFFAMRGGLEEMRDRMRSDSLQPIPALAFPLIPASMPGTAANSIVYITNPSLGENVDPETFGNTFFDDEFCHEHFTAVGPVTPVGTPCIAAGAPPAGSVAQPYVASMSPNTGTLGSLKYKWARITMKQNGTFQVGATAAGLVDPSQGIASPVCWDAFAYQERVASAMGGSADCATAVANGFNVQPLYLITSMAITPSGSRRIGQYEVASFNVAAPPSGLTLDGPPAAADFNPPSSTNAVVDGVDGSYPTKPGSKWIAPPPVAGCNPNTGNHAAIGVDNAAAQAVVTAQISKPDNYQGLNWVPTVTPSVVPLPLLGTNNWSNPTMLNNLTSEMANVADVTCPGSAMCSSSTYGTDASPQITYVNGDFTMGSGTSGAGVLVVTGNFTINGKMEYDGLILVIGQGSVTVSGAGDGTIFGELFVANTNGAVGGVLGPPSFTWNGGGSAGVFYNSCWAAVGNNLHYMVVASREEMY